jgi:hypothetical protein
MKFSLVAIFGLALMPVAADPGSSATYLMNEPATMMDVGILQTQEMLSGGKGSDGAEFIASVSFDWDKNQFKIEATRIYPPYIGSKEKARQECRVMVNKVRLQLGVSPATGKPLFGKSSNFAQAFSHSGFEKKSIPKTLYSDIDAMTRVSANLDALLTAKATEPFIVKCEGDLMGSEILFSE